MLCPVVENIGLPRESVRDGIWLLTVSKIVYTMKRVLQKWAAFTLKVNLEPLGKLGLSEQHTVTSLIGENEFFGSIIYILNDMIVSTYRWHYHSDLLSDAHIGPRIPGINIESDI